VRAELARAEATLADLTTRAAELEATLAHELALPDLASGPLRERFDAHRVREVKRELAAVVEQRDLYTDRVAALRAELPKQAQIAEAERLADRYIAAVATHDADRSRAWREFVSAMGEAERTARAVAVATAGGREMRGRLQALAEQFALTIELPARMQTLPESEIAEAITQTVLLRGAASSQAIDAEIDRELSARRTRASAA
jgi:hypothetical protein